MLDQLLGTIATHVVTEDLTETDELADGVHLVGRKGLDLTDNRLAKFSMRLAAGCYVDPVG